MRRRLAAWLRRTADRIDRVLVHEGDEFVRHVATELSYFGDAEQHQFTFLLSGIPATWSSLFEVGVYVTAAEFKTLFRDGEVHGLEAYGLQTVRPVMYNDVVEDVTEAR